MDDFIERYFNGNPDILGWIEDLYVLLEDGETGPYSTRQAVVDEICRLQSQVCARALHTYFAESEAWREDAGGI